MSHQYSSVPATRSPPPTGVSSRWKAAAAFFAASQLLRYISPSDVQAPADHVHSYMLLAIVVGDASHDLRFDKLATYICTFILHAMCVTALIGIAGIQWQKRYFLLQLFRWVISAQVFFKDVSTN